VALRDSMRESAAQYLRPGEPIQAVIGAQTASQWLAALTGIFVFLGLNRYRILAVTPARIVVLDAGKTSMKTARGVVTELPRPTRLGPGTGLWHRIPAGRESLRVHRRFFKDIETADTAAAHV
jgi:cytosine/adenosine deaminase-related metal-dependent hydrolase